MMLNVQPGDFVVVPVEGDVGYAIEGAQWLERLIEERKLKTPLKYEHAEVYVGMADAAGPHGYTYSAYPDRQGKKALAQPPEQMSGAIWSSGIIQLTPAQRTAIVAWCEAHPNVKYSDLDYFALIGHTLGWYTKWLEDYIKSQDSMICSQYTDSAYDSSGVHLFTDGRWPGFVTPLDLALLLLSKGATPMPVH